MRLIQIFVSFLGGHLESIIYREVVDIGGQVQLFGDGVSDLVVGGF